MYSIGKRIEGMIRAEVTEKLGNKLEVTTAESSNERLTVDDIQNGQDIVISYNGQDIYYIEVKSKRNFLSPAYMSKNQIRMACQHPDKYALCCVDLSNAHCVDIDNPTIDELIPHTRFNNEIGSLLSPLVTPVLKADEDTEDNNIKLNGDYTASVPESIFIKRLTISAIIEEILAKIKS